MIKVIVLVMLAWLRDGTAHAEVLPLPLGTTMADCLRDFAPAEMAIDPQQVIIKFGFRCVEIEGQPVSGA